MTKTIDYYNNNANNFAASTLDVNFTATQDRFIASLPQASPLVLDFGCGSGRDSRYFLSKGLQVEAVDGSEAMCQIAAQVIKQPVRCMLFGQLAAEARYDGIWACSSILHLPKAELMDVLGKLHRALKPGGVLYSSFKYGDFSGMRNGRYFTDLTESSFGELLQAVPGLELVETWVTGDVRPGREAEQWLNVLLRRVD